MIDDPTHHELIIELSGAAGTLEEYVVDDKNGIAFDVGAGQNRPVGIKWDDGTHAFVYTAIKRRREERNKHQS